MTIFNSIIFYLLFPPIIYFEKNRKMKKQQLFNIDKYVYISETETNLSINVSLVGVEGHFKREKLESHLQGTLFSHKTLRKFDKKVF